MNFMSKEVMLLTQQYDLKSKIDLVQFHDGTWGLIAFGKEAEEGLKSWIEQMKGSLNV